MTQHIKMNDSKFPHIKWIDLYDDGTRHECAVMKQDDLGNVYYFELNKLDDVDKRRLFNIISNRNSHMHELWDLMGNVTLGNGVNALDYFHQLVRVRTPSGQIIAPTSGHVGMAQPQQPASNESQGQTEA